VSDALCAAGGKEQFEASEQVKHGLVIDHFHSIHGRCEDLGKCIQEFAISLYLKKNLLKSWWQPRFRRQLNFIGRVWKQSGITHCFLLLNPTLGGGGEARSATSGILRYEQSGDTTWPRKELH
jgi:hypothetical protein